MKIEGLKILEKIYEGNKTLIYKAKPEGKAEEIVIKILNHNFPTKEMIARFKYEFFIQKEFDSDVTVQAIDFFKNENYYMFTMDYFPGKPFREIMQSDMDIKQKLNIFINILETLDKIHQKKFIHKDIAPSNILYDEASKTIKIIDFGISVNLSEEVSSGLDNKLEGTPSYISPEQTGRTGKSIDYRSDYYSLGITLYEWLTGVKPFGEDTDILELVHSHIAKVPTSPNTINPEIPKPISDIVMKLIAKNAEERYQSVSGIIHDIKFCLNNWKQKQTLKKFIIGQLDYSGKFQVPQKLYGRENEVNILLQAYEENLKGNSEIAIISGFSGIGKTALVQSLGTKISENRGYFCFGKYDQFKKNVPYSALIQALRSLIKKILSESESSILIWQKKILEALRSNGQVIVNVIPELEILIGKQPAVQELPPSDSQNRFLYTLKEFLFAFCKKDHPIVLFLDDLQWADTATLDFLKNIFEEKENVYLFIILAYRDNEVGESHPLVHTIKHIEKLNVKFNDLNLKPITINAIQAMLKDTFHNDDLNLDDLAYQIYSKTGGNPFFIGELLRKLYSDNIIYYDQKQNLWKWELEKIQKISVTENILDLLISNMKELDPSTQKILQFSSVLGHQFDLVSLSQISNTSRIDLIRELYLLIESKLILPLDTDYKLKEDLGQNPLYKFYHDRIQQAAYLLIEKKELDQLHYKIGFSLLDNSSPEEVEEKVYTIVNHINLGRHLSHSDEEKKKIFVLNWKASQKAKKASVFSATFEYLKIALEYEEFEQDKYELYLEFSRSALMVGEFELVEKYITLAIQNTSSPLKKARAYEVLVGFYLAQNNPPLAIKITLEALEVLGIKISQTPSEAEIGTAIVSTQSLWEGKDIMSFLNLPLMKDEEKIIAMQLLATVMPVTYVAAQQLVPMFATTMLSLSIQYGNAHASCFAYTTYGLILCGMGALDAGYQFGQLGIKLIGHINASEYKAKTYFYQYLFIHHWKDHLANSLEPALDGYKVGLESGDISNATLCAMLYGYHSYFVGAELSGLIKEMESFSKMMKSNKQDFALLYNNLYLEGVKSWVEPMKNGKLFFEDFYSSVLPSLYETQNFSAVWIVFLNRMNLSYILKNYKHALEYALEAEKYMAAGAAAITPPMFCLYSTLIYTALFNEFNQEEKDSYLLKINENIAKMKTWSDSAPMNFLHKFYLMEAELFRVQGNWDNAMRSYDKAIHLASENGYIQEEALANELAYEFWKSLNMKDFAESYLRKSHYCYTQWGAIVKTQKMEETHPELVRLKKIKQRTLETTGTSTSSTVSTSLDLLTIIKAAQIISQEIILENLLKKFMEVILENVGGTYACFIGKHNNEFILEAIARITTDNLIHCEATSEKLKLEGDISEVPIPIVLYALRTQEPLLLNNVSKDGLFSKNKYIIDNEVKSVLCFPLVQKNQITGLLYLENNLITEAFTEDRVATIKILISQAAISIENARLFDDMKRLNEANQKFVPTPLLSILEKKSITDLKLGDQTQREMSVLFSDIRGFSSLSEQMTPKENFQFINSYLSKMGPPVRRNNGFIDKYIGDAIMALFPRNVDDAIQAAIEMQKELNLYNEYRSKQGEFEVAMGMGIHSGSLMLGIIGESERMEGTVISDTVNLASRLEGLTKVYGVSLLITKESLIKSQKIDDLKYRLIDHVIVKGKNKSVEVYQIFDGLSSKEEDLLMDTKLSFELGIDAYRDKKFTEALELFLSVQKKSPNDKPVEIYIQRCKHAIEFGVSEDWTGVVKFTEK